MTRVSLENFARNMGELGAEGGESNRNR